MKIPRLRLSRIALLGAALVPAVALTFSSSATASAAPPFTASVEKGVQIYTCDAATRVYKFSRPQATLVTWTGTEIQHGAGPSWSAPDGSGVTGTLVASIWEGDDRIPGLVLKATNHSAPGTLFAGVTSIRRANTGGGLGPTGKPCTPGVDQDVESPYTATYIFE